MINYLNLKRIFLAEFVLLLWGVGRWVICCSKDVVAYFFFDGSKTQRCGSFGSWTPEFWMFEPCK